VSSKNTGKAPHRQNWATPLWLFDRLEKEFGKFDVDVSPFTKPEAWLEKGYRHVRDDGGFGVYILPATTDTAWFHDFAALGSIIFLRGRVQFVPPPDYEKFKDNGNNNGTMLLIYDQGTIVEPQGTRDGPLLVTSLRWAPKGPAQSTYQGAQQPLFGL
jgi:hypothetical protein